MPPEQRGWEWRYLKRQTRGGVFTLYGHTGPVNSVAFSPDGTRILTGSSDFTAKLWDARTGTPCPQPEGTRERGDKRRVQPGRDADRHRQPGQDGEDLGRENGGSLARTQGVSGGVTSIAFSPDGERIVTGSDSWSTPPDEATIWDTRTGISLLKLKGHRTESPTRRSVRMGGGSSPAAGTTQRRYGTHGRGRPCWS